MTHDITWRDFMIAIMVVRYSFMMHDVTWVDFMMAIKVVEAGRRQASNEIYSSPVIEPSA